MCAHLPAAQPTSSLRSIAKMRLPAFLNQRRTIVVYGCGSLLILVLSIYLYLATSSVRVAYHPVFTNPPVEEGWTFDSQFNGNNHGLTNEQCDAAFPDFYAEIDRAVNWRKLRNLPRIQESQLDVSWRKEGEIVRLMIYERQLYVIDYRWAGHGFDIPRALALLHAIHRSIIAYPGFLPNIEFTMSLGDWPGDPDAKWPIWVLTRFHQEEDKWVMPDFGYWAWPLDVIGEYSQLRRAIRDNEPASLAEKIPKLVWRGATRTNALREDLVQASDGKSWSDVRAILWANMTSFNDDSKDAVLSMVEHCDYQFLAHTEGHTYSGRGKYLLNCASVSVVHDPEWIEPHTHLMISKGPEQNIVRVKRDFSDLDENMLHYLENPAEAERVVQNSVKTFRDRYLTPAAQSCYWRKLFFAWSTISFEPELYDTARDSRGKLKIRGLPFETFVSELVMPAEMAVGLG